jgi:hypothetical protein
VGVLHDACQRADLPSASLWAAVPAYASQVPSAKATLALVTRVCGMIGTPTPVGPLSAAARDYETRVTAMVNNDDDLIGYVARLEAMGYDDLDDDEVFEVDDDDDDVDDISLTTLNEAVLDSDELMAEVEQFLREQPEP